MQRDNRKEPRPIMNIPIHVFDGKTHIEGTTINLSGSGLCCSRPDSRSYNKGKLLILSFNDPFSQKKAHYLGEVIHDLQLDNCSTTGIQIQQLSSLNQHMIENIVSDSALSY